MPSTSSVVSVAELGVTLLPQIWHHLELQVPSAELLVSETVEAVDGLGGDYGDALSATFGWSLTYGSAAIALLLVFLWSLRRGRHPHQHDEAQTFPLAPARLVSMLLPTREVSEVCHKRVAVEVQTQTDGRRSVCLDDDHCLQACSQARKEGFEAGTHAERLRLQAERDQMESQLAATRASLAHMASLQRTYEARMEVQKRRLVESLQEVRVRGELLSKAEAARLDAESAAQRSESDHHLARLELDIVRGELQELRRALQEEPLDLHMKDLQGVHSISALQSCGGRALLVH